MNAQVYFNGRFFTAQPSGVQRVAQEMLRALDELPPENVLRGGMATLLLPKNAATPSCFHRLKVAHSGVLPGNLWEQFELPARARDGLLVNLCNIGPLSHRGSVTMIHDAQVFLSPVSYSRSFAAWYRTALPILGRRAARVLTVSEFSKRMLVEHGVAAADHIQVIHNGVDHILRNKPDFSVISRLGLQEGRYVLALSNTQKHKNIPLLFQAFRSARLNGVTLALMGGATRADFELAGHATPPNVLFTGRVSDNEARGLMERAICFACPSLTEGFGLPPLEAMLTGCPAIVANRGALPEVCGSAALIADPDAVDDWINGIERLRTDSELRARLTETGKLQANHFTWRNSALALVQVLNSIM